MKSKRLESVRIDKETKEELKGTEMFIPFREKIKEDFTMIFRDSQSIERMFHDPDMTAETVRVFFFLLNRIDYENRLIIHQAEVAQELRITPATMSRIMKKLVDKHFLNKEIVGRSTIYTVDCEVAWRGSASNLKHKRTETRKESMNHAIQN